MSEKRLDILDRRADEYILEHYMEPDLDRNRIATALGCSTRNLSRAFKKYDDTCSYSNASFI